LAITNVQTLRMLRLLGRALLAVIVIFPIIWVLFIAADTNFGSAVSNPRDFFITLLNGLTAAALYFVVASGFTLIFGLMRVVNMAHGAFFLFGGYVALRLQRDMVGASGAGISSSQVSFTQWFLPLLAGAAVVAGIGC
jgi:branched-chain amino acid transport system permease protein